MLRWRKVLKKRGKGGLKTTIPEKINKLWVRGKNKG